MLILEGSPQILSMYPDDLQQKARQQLEALGVENPHQHIVTDVQPGYVMVGRSASTPWSRYGPQACSHRRWANAWRRNRPQGLRARGPVPEPQRPSRIFVCGDLAHVEEKGRLLPGVAQPAIQMGTYAARRIGSLIGHEAGSEAATPSRSTTSTRATWPPSVARPPSHASCGPSKRNWSGFMAWLAWLMVHIYFLIGFRNRLGVFRQWAWTYLTLQDGARLITGSQDLPGWKDEADKQDAA